MKVLFYQVFPYNIFTYCSICRVDCKFARNKKNTYKNVKKHFTSMHLRQGFATSFKLCGIQFYGNKYI
jgi:hypothetical protein